MNEHEFEPVRGLPELLPAGETTIWRGEPVWRSLARRVFHTRKIGFYFALLIVLSTSSKLYSGVPAADLTASLSWQLALAAIALGIFYFLAWLYARTTVYTITSERLVLRFGVALTMVVTIPWSKIVQADLLSHDDGTGDIVFTLDPQRRMSYILLWPLVRPWRFSPVSPAIRCIPDADSVAARLAEVLHARFDSAPAEQSGPAAVTPVFGGESGAPSAT